MNSHLLSYICCPQTGEQLKIHEGELYTDKTSYPLFNDIPWLFNSPEFSFLEWGSKITQFIAEETDYLGYLQLLINSETNELSKKRYEKLAEAKAYNLEVFQQKLALFIDQQQVKLLPSNQQIFSYFQQIFRDWCWEAEELDEYTHFIKQHIDHKTQSILVLGAGACGLSHRLAKQYSDKTFISTDHNPFLFFMAQDIFTNKKVSLYDYSFYPKDLAHTHKKWNIENCENLDNHHFVLSSFPELPFNPESFDLIIAPWFLDILDLSLPESMNAIYDYLKPDGKFISLGPANIHHRDLDRQLCPEEFKQELSRYFHTSHYTQKSLFYLKNPLESQSRKEEVAFFIGQNKTQKLELDKMKSEKTLKFTPALETLKLTQKTMTQILNLIDKDISVSELAKKLELEFKFSSVEAEFYAEAFILKIQEQL
ncbi:MAG: hypothetical protein CME62_17005 [Halobacteriovoraceae bacterium]|nr:hypothetical protein [Halobacteriovoraceae bacterium]|tara:strand:+ start:12488 stop:13762 length:1275 start_codon:yes stop_codon:yes gene_type:complete